MSRVLKKAAILALMLIGLASAATAGLGLRLRYQPAPPMKPASRFAGRVFNPPVFGYLNRFRRKSQPLVYHRERKSGKEYVTPSVCLRRPKGPSCLPPSARTWTGRSTCAPLPNRESSTREPPTTLAEVIDLEQTIEYAGGPPGCPSWTLFKVLNLVLLHPLSQAALQSPKAPRA